MGAPSEHESVPREHEGPFDGGPWHDTLASVIATMDDGVLVTDADGRLVYQGGAAQEILERLGMTAEVGEVLAWPAEAAAIPRLIASCGSAQPGPAGGFAEIPRNAGRGLRANVQPVPSNQPLEGKIAQWARPVAVIVLSDPELRLERVGQRLGTLYGLTPAEIRFAIEIAQGDGKRRAAERCGISYTTARAHLSSIFEKTGVHRQAELVRLFLG